MALRQQAQPDGPYPLRLNYQDIDRERRLATPELVAGLSPEPLDLMTQAARQGRLEVVREVLEQH